MKYEIKDEVVCYGKRCLVAATRNKPHKPTFDLDSRVKVFPKNDYLLYIFDEKSDRMTYYTGVLDVDEGEIESRYFGE